MKKTTIIVPIHIFDEEYANMIKKTYENVKSLNNDNLTLMYVGPDLVIKECSKLLNDNTVIYLTNTSDEYNFVNQVNFAVNNVKTEYFSILEVDDTYKLNWFDNLDIYMSENEASLYLPLNELLTVDGKFIGYLNEMAWNIGMVEELGVIDMETLKVYMDFNITGGLFKTNDFIEVGGLKSSFKIASSYEFLMRFTEFGKKTFVLPKVGYYHMTGRKNSNMVAFKEILSDEELEWLIKRAHKEYKDKEDSNLTFEK